MKCKVCGTKVHYCSNCDYDKYLYSDYCSEKCFNKSDEYKKAIEDLVNLISKMDETSLKIKGEYFEIDDIYHNIWEELTKKDK